MAKERRCKSERSSGEENKSTNWSSDLALLKEGRKELVQPVHYGKSLRLVMAKLHLNFIRKSEVYNFSKAL